MCPRRRSRDATAGCAHQQALLNEEWFIDVLDRFFGFANADGECAETNWSATELLTQIRENGAVDLVETKIVDPATGEECGVNQDGEVCIRGPLVMTGYLNKPEATAAMIDPEGWLHTGDLARMDEAGHIWLAGRVKDVVRRAGENVAAREVEDSLVSDPRVRLAAVTGVPDEIRGEEVKAYLVVTEPWDARQAAEQLRPELGERLASFKVPRYWEVREDLPRTPSERVAKKEIVPGRTWDAVEEAWQ